MASSSTEEEVAVPPIQFINPETKDKDLFDRIVYALRGAVLAKMNVDTEPRSKDFTPEKKEKIVKQAARSYFVKAAQTTSNKEEWGELGTIIINRSRKYRDPTSQKIADTLFSMNPEFPQETWDVCYQLVKAIWMYAFDLKGDDSGLEDPDTEKQLSRTEAAILAYLIRPSDNISYYIGGSITDSLKKGFRGLVNRSRDAYTNVKGRLFGKKTQVLIPAEQILPSSILAMKYGPSPTRTDEEPIPGSRIWRFSTTPYPIDRLRFWVEVQSITHPASIVAIQPNMKPAGNTMNALEFYPFAFYTPDAWKYRSKGPSGVTFSKNYWDDPTDGFFMLKLPPGEQEVLNVALTLQNNSFPAGMTKKQRKDLEFRPYTPYSDKMGSLVKGTYPDDMKAFASDIEMEARYLTQIKLTLSKSLVGRVTRHTTKAAFEQEFRSGTILIFRTQFYYQSPDGGKRRFFVNYFFQKVTYGELTPEIGPKTTQSIIHQTISNGVPLLGDDDNLLLCKEININFPGKQSSFPTLAGTKTYYKP